MSIIMTVVMYVLYLYSFTTQSVVTKPVCVYPDTGLTLLPCGYQWGEWNCSECENGGKTERKRTICCEDDQPMDQCLQTCHLPVNGEKEEDDCAMHCSSTPDRAKRQAPLSPTTAQKTLKTPIPSESPCYVEQTQKWISSCDFSSWLAWDCSKCKHNWPENTGKTDRRRLICCYGIATQTQTCLGHCEKPPESDRDEGLCVEKCPLLSSSLPVTVTSNGQSIASVKLTRANRQTSALKHTSAQSKTSTSGTTVLFKTTSVVYSAPTSEGDTTALPYGGLKASSGSDGESLGESGMDESTSGCGTMQGGQCVIGIWKLNSDPEKIWNSCTVILLSVFLVLLLAVFVLATAIIRLELKIISMLRENAGGPKIDRKFPFGENNVSPLTSKASCAGNRNKRFADLAKCHANSPLAVPKGTAKLIDVKEA